MPARPLPEAYCRLRVTVSPGAKPVPLTCVVPPMATDVAAAVRVVTLPVTTVIGCVRCWLPAAPGTAAERTTLYVPEIVPVGTVIVVVKAPVELMVTT